jgi:UDP-N-acetylglucosamine:LPS N-acetylglucosamine transferase
MILESELNAQLLIDTLKAMFEAPATLAHMATNARTLARPNAVQTIAEMVLAIKK